MEWVGVGEVHEGNGAWWCTSNAIHDNHIYGGNRWLGLIGFRMGSGSDTVQVSILIPTHVRMYRIRSEGTYQHSYVRRSKANPSLASSESRPNQLPTILSQKASPFCSRAPWRIKSHHPSLCASYLYLNLLEILTKLSIVRGFESGRTMCLPRGNRSSGKALAAHFSRSEILKANWSEKVFFN